MAPSGLGGGHDQPGPAHGRAGQHCRQCRAAQYRARPRCLAGLLDLGGECVPTGDRQPAAAAGLPSAIFSAIAASISSGSACLAIAGSLGCALAHSLPMLVGRTYRGPGRRFAAGIMSVNTALLRFTYPRRDAGAGPGHQRHGGCDVLGHRADGRLGDPCDRTMAVAVRGQCADRGGWPSAIGHLARCPSTDRHMLTLLTCRAQCDDRRTSSAC